MNTSLRDQLLKAGLVTEKQARQAAQQEQQRQFRNRPPKHNPDSRPGQGSQGSGQRPGQNSGQNQGRPTGQNAGQHSGQNRGPNTGQHAGQNPGQNINKGPGQQQHSNPGGANVRAGQAPQAPSASLLAQQAQAAKVARDQELNRRREEKAKRRARIAEIEQIIDQNRAPRLETEDYYSFIDGKKIRRMSVDPQRREQLTSGVLAIVRYKGHYAVVPKAIAERIRERDENMVVPVVQPKETAEPDDAYKDFVVPDDLMW
jgi:uncharacterized protein YaiL (DUF2058 family)